MPAGRAQNEGKGGGKGRTGTKKISGVDFSWDPDLGNDTPAPTPLYPVSQTSVSSVLRDIHISTPEDSTDFSSHTNLPLLNL